MAKKKDVAPNGKYPWDKWFGKKKFTLKGARDYDCMAHCMAVQIRNQARRRKVRVSITTSNIGTLEVEVMPLRRKK